MKKLVTVALAALLLLLSIACSASVIDEAFSHLGEPYRYGRQGPHSFDCSGFTYYCYLEIEGIKLKRSAKAQGYDDTYEKIEEIEDLKIGDLVFFNTNTRDSDLSDHAGLYIGDGYFIHASSGKNKHKVVISTLLEGFYNEHFSWGRRVVEDIWHK